MKPISKELFIETIKSIQKQHEYDVKCAKLINEVYSDAFHANLQYKNHYLSNQLVKILQEFLNDDIEESWIEYFIWDLDFGKNNDRLKAHRADGSEIPLSTAGELYDFLVENHAWYITLSKWNLPFERAVLPVQSRTERV